MALHQLRKLAVLSLAKKDPDGASFLHGTFLIGKFWQEKKTKYTVHINIDNRFQSTFSEERKKAKFGVQKQWLVFIIGSRKTTCILLEKLL